MSFYRCTVRDWLRHVKAEIFFDGLPSDGRLRDAVASHGVCQGLEGAQAFRTRYRPILRDPRLDPRGRRWRYSGASVEVVLEQLDPW